MNTSNSDDESKDIKKGWFNAGIITISLAVFLPFIIMVLSDTSFSVSKIGELGTVGDFFGGTTIGLLSIASIFFIIHTISIQSKELSLQRQELQLTRTELEETRKVHEESNKTQLIQRFETTFFNLLSRHNDIVANMKTTRSSSKDRIGRSVILYIYYKFEIFYNSLRDSDMSSQKKIESISTDFLGYYGDDIGHYFRNMYQIISFIDKSNLTHEEKLSYIEILKAQFSLSEFKLTFYYSIMTKDQKLQDVVLKYNLFSEQLKRSDLIEEEHYELLK